MKLAAIAAPLTAAIGILTAYLLTRNSFAGRALFEFGTMLSFAVPGTVIGVAYILAFNVPPIEMTGTGLILVLCFVFRNLPVGVRAGMATMAQIDTSLDEASATLGARGLTTLTRVILPLLKPALAGALVYSFVRAMTTVSAVVFLVSPDHEMATTYIIGRVINGDYGVAIAYSSALIVLMLAAVVAIQLVVGTRRLAAVAAPTGRPRPYCRKRRMTAARVELRSVSKRFGEVAAVRDVSFTVEPGTLVTILGPSGCGKTTTLRLLAGLDFVSAGQVLIGDADVTALPPPDRNISMVFQSYALFPHMTVLENVSYGLRVSKLAKAAAAARARVTLESVGLTGLEDRLPSELSGGQQQRVAVARALVLEPAVLLFDEPLSNLDAGLRRHMRGEIRDLQQRLELTVVYVTHDQSEAMAISDRIMVMERGVIAQDGTPRELYEAPASEFVAGFMGEANRVEGRLDARDGETGVLHLGALTLRLPHRGRQAGPVTVAIRPEAIVVGPKGSAGLAATVVKVGVSRRGGRVHARERARRAVRGGARRTGAVLSRRRRGREPGRPRRRHHPSEVTQPMEQALSDVTVLDLGQVIAMPFCTMLLADLGAKVIKVESRERGRERVSLGIKRTRNGVEERVPVAQYRDRNKLGITLELKTPQGVALFKELVARVDVVTENFSVGTMDRLNLGYEELKTINPRLIYASVTAFGQTGRTRRSGATTCSRRRSAAT